MKSFKYRATEVGFPETVEKFGDVVDYALQDPSSKRCWFVVTLLSIAAEGYHFKDQGFTDWNLLIEYFTLLALDCEKREWQVSLKKE